MNSVLGKLHMICLVFRSVQDGTSVRYSTLRGIFWGGIILNRATSSLIVYPCA